ncbi:hypothetical protein DSM112329_02217 [Paraconexibacter sp. AEG42_29]|uniref:Secreted protein n=1 Tax=Paraconexibacter sp. AEG42_29 TaxID=2997339 RepID=A0AAU7AUU0_9ACTN
MPAPMPCLNSVTTVVLLAVLGGGAGGGALSASAQAAAPARCDQLGGRNLAVGSTAIRVGFRAVKTKRADVRVYYGCAAPRGRVFELGRKGDIDLDTGATARFAVGKHAGRYLITTTYADGGIASLGKLSKQVWDLRTGRTRNLYSQPTAEGDICVDGAGSGDRASYYDPARFVISPAGVVAGIYRPNACGSVTGARLVVSVPGPGGLRVVDRGATVGALPLASLSVRGRRVSWVNGGTKRSKTV